MSKEKTVYVLGAGFSRDAGYPLVDHFTDQIFIRKIRKKVELKYRKKFNKIVEFMKNRIENGYCKDIEDILNHVSVARYLGVGSNWEGSTRYMAENIYFDVQWFIVKVIKESGHEQFQKTFDEFVKKSIKNEDVFISFNYDLLLEKCFENINKKFNYFLDDRKRRGTTFLKLHGSVNWAFCRGKCNKVVVDLKKYIALGIYDKTAKCPVCGSRKLSPMLIPPMLNKDLYYEGYETGDIVRKIWNLALDKLCNATKIIFIGLSMNYSDTYARGLFKLSSNMDSGQKVKYYIINKSINPELTRKYKSVFINDTPTSIEQGFIEYAKSYKPYFP